MPPLALDRSIQSWARAGCCSDRKVIVRRSSSESWIRVTPPLSLLKEELVQREYEGHPIPDEIREKVAVLDKEGDWMNTSAIDPLFDQIGKLPRSTAFHFEQPNDLESIKNARPDGPRKLEHLSSARILDQLHGAWTGRACGCALGKPVEGIGMRGLKGMDGRETIRPGR